jgi:hypothetical protein
MMEEENKVNDSNQTKPPNDIKDQSEHKAQGGETLVSSLIFKKLSVETSL